MIHYWHELSVGEHPPEVVAFGGFDGKGRGADEVGHFLEDRLKLSGINVTSPALSRKSVMILANCSHLRRRTWLWDGVAR